MIWKMLFSAIYHAIAGGKRSSSDYNWTHNCSKYRPPWQSVFMCFFSFLSASLYFSKRGAY